MIVPNGGDAKEDEDEGVAHTAPHLHEVFNGCMGLERDVGFHVALHAQGTRNDSEEGKRSNLLQSFSSWCTSILLEQDGEMTS